MPTPYQQAEGAVGPVDSQGDSINSKVESFINGVGDAAYFDAFQNSGNLNNLKGDKPTVLVYPEDMHNNPTKGCIIHFDVFYKKPAKMEDVTNTVKKFFGASDVGDVGKDALDKVTGQATQAGKDFITSAKTTINGARDELLQSINGVSSVSNWTADVTEEETRLGKATEQSLDKVTLYMPAGLQNTDTLTYSEQDFAAVKNVLNAEIDALIPGIASAAAGLADSVVNIAGGELNSEAALNAVTGAVRNPRKEQLFNEVGFRTFSFTFKFYPKSKKESHDVMEIVKLFRFHAHPIVTSNQVFYNMPSEFALTFIDLTYPTLNPFQQIGSFFGNEYGGVTARENQWINKVGRCVLESVSVNYNAVDKLSVFPDGAPTAVELTLNFKELEAISRNKVKIGY
jgi:hypothetical protein